MKTTDARARRRALSRILGLVGATLLVAAPMTASAASFDDEGAFSFDADAVFTVDFDEDIVNEEGGPSLTVEDAGALSGGRVLTLGAFEGTDVAMELPEGAGRYRVSAWVRDGEVISDVEVRYADNTHPGVDEIGVLYPTGRMTSDGWIEVANDHIRVDATRGATVSVGFFAASGGSADAVEVVRLGDLAHDEFSGQACEGSADPRCGSDQQCLFSQCRYLGGTVPDIPEDRDEVAAYLRARLDLLFGPLLNREVDLPNSRLALDRMATAENPWEYWNAFMLAVRRLHDGHTTTSGLSDFVLENEKPMGLCFIEGDADMSHGIAPKDPFYLDVLVSHGSGYRDFGLKPGDRLVAIDGRHPIAWAAAQTEQFWGMSPTSNHRTFAELAEQLRGLISRLANELTVIRCDATTHTCSEPETIDLSTIPTIQPDEEYAGVQCDNRPLRHLPDSPADHAISGSARYGISTSSDATERIYGVEWESLYATTGSDGVAGQLLAAVNQFKIDARGVILDHRSGNGGTILGPKPLWDFALPHHPISVYYDREHLEDEQPDLATGLERFQFGLDNGLADFAGSNNPTTMPVALLITRDVSASDWLPLGFKGGPDNVKIFGPFETNGGFSTRYGFGYWLGLNTVIAVGDTFDPTGRTRNGRGVEPDIVVLPKQSDLIMGKDSVYEAALAWIRQRLLQTGLAQ